MSEIEMVKRYIRKQNHVDYCIETPYFMRSIDYVCKQKNGEFTIIEFKKNNWKKCIEQAEYCSGSAEYIYICINEMKNVNKVEEYIKNKGLEIGLITYNSLRDEFRNVIKARRQNTINLFKSILEEGFTFSSKNISIK